MAFDIAKARVAGPQRITFKGIVLGHTIDGVDFEAQREFTEVKVDKYGNTPIDFVLAGNNVSIHFKMAQADWDQLNAAIPETSSHDGSGSRDRIDLGADAGYSLRQDAGVLVIHPMGLSDADFSQDITIYLAVSVETIPIPLKVDEQKTVEVTMRGLVSEEYGTGRRLGHIGPADVS